MGTTLHNKIHLGRTSFLSSRPVQAACCIALFVSVGLAWMALHALK